jgi:NAD(P)-dependent dehydrogenase (short-subunit alcohol dehydrogenase family)
MNVVLNARRADRLDAVAERVRAAGGQAVCVTGCVTERECTSRLLDAAREHFGGFHAVFANAGYGLDRPAHVMTDDLRQIFEVNFFASHDLLREAAARLIDAGAPGHLLMCSSCLARFPLPGNSAYSATKAAQWHLCRAMAIELEPHDIDVSCVHPITTETEFHQVSQVQSGKERPAHAVPGHAPRLFVQRPERVARAVVKCLMRPRPEVWTSFTVRAVAAALTWSPAFLNFVMRSAMKNDGKEDSRVQK